MENTISFYYEREKTGYIITGFSDASAENLFNSICCNVEYSSVCPSSEYNEDEDIEHLIEMGATTIKKNGKNIDLSSWLLHIVIAEILNEKE